MALVLEHDDLKLHINGYVGYKYITGSAKNSAIESQPELGTELSLDINENWSAFTQFTYDKTIDTALVYSFLTYQTMVTDDLSIKLNGGRLRHDVGLYNNTRVNPRTRPGVIVPQSIYWDSLKHLLVSGDGVNLQLKYKNLEIGYTIDNPMVTNPQEEAKVWTSVLLNKIDTYFGSHQLVNIKYSFDDIPLIIKTSWTRLDLGDDNTQIMKYAFPYYANKHQFVEFFNAGLIYTYDTWTFSAESLLVKPFYGDWINKKHSKGLSFTLSKEITDEISVYTNYNEYKSAPVQTPYEWYPDAKDLNFGVNYHKDSWMVGAEVHHINGGRWADPFDFKKNPYDYKDWWMIGVNAVYFF